MRLDDWLRVYTRAISPKAIGRALALISEADTIQIDGEPTVPFKILRFFPSLN